MDPHPHSPLRIVLPTPTLRLKFGSRVGLITGDVTLEEDSPCLVMTTEILRGVLYRGSTLMRELKWLIIDEVHLLGDGARGWVIEPEAPTLSREEEWMNRPIRS